MAVLFSSKLHSTNSLKCCHCDRQRMIQYPYFDFHYFICKIKYIFTCLLTLHIYFIYEFPAHIYL